MFTKKDIRFQFNASDKSWTMSVGRFAQTTHFGRARPSSKPRLDDQLMLVARANRDGKEI
jgi:hypothetical protein|tara:strand:- start:5423 stop:5602 length:180 start_codon:yes stop_codon:yes gene_type:complete